MQASLIFIVAYCVVLNVDLAITPEKHKGMSITIAHNTKVSMVQNG